MAKITDGTFRDWQDTEVIDAIEYKRERELLKVAINDNDDRISEVEAAVEAVQLDETQITKITNNEGGVKFGVTSTSGDILAELLTLGRGMHTFYAVSGSKNLPPTNISIRGMAHFTDDERGWVYASDYQNNVFTNYYDVSSGWLGWKSLGIKPSEVPLWSGNSQANLLIGNMYSGGNDNVTPTKKLSECNGGWILVWSDADQTQANNFNFTTTTIPKQLPKYVNGAPFSESISAGSSTGSLEVTANKTFYIYDDRIVGHPDNALGFSVDVCLRFVFEY